MYKAIGFDLHGVIVGNAMPHFLEHVCRELGVMPGDLMTALDSFRHQFETGHITVEEFWRQVTSKLGVEYDPGEGLRDWTRYYLDDHPAGMEMLELADRLKRSGYTVALLSNTNLPHSEVNRRRGLFEHFDPVLLSHEIGVMKPDPKAFQALVERLGLKAEEIIFIDDLPGNIVVAEQVGLKGIVFSGYVALIDELAELGVKLDPPKDQK